MKRNLLNIFIALVILSVTSCSKWLDVQPKTSIPGEELFTSESGFKDALTGCYLKMIDSRLYSGDLKFGYLDVLAGLYNNYPSNTSVDWPTMVWDFGNYFRPTKDAIYSKLYNVIVNVNSVLGNLESNRDVLKTKNYYEIMKGEALALRAFLHFDLLRLYGPVYCVDPNGKAIPYRTAFNSDATPVLTAKEVVACILKDLNEAETLLSEFDTDLFWTSSNEDGIAADQFLVQRQMRMNKYAVKAMLARVYCYCGDADSKTKAVNYANEVIDSGFFTLYESRSNGILYNEHIFALSAYELDKTILSSYSSAVSGVPLNSQYYMNEGNFNNVFAIGNGGDTDWRAGNSAFATKNEFGQIYKVCRKYEQDNLTLMNGKDVIPLIRLPEMYYIIAECGTPSESSEALNAVRWTRGISYDLEIVADENYDKPQTDHEYDPAQTYRTYAIRDEIRKEYFAEGMLFFFYKMHNFKTFEGCALKDVRNNYKMPLPDDEISFGNNN